MLKKYCSTILKCHLLALFFYTNVAWANELDCSDYLRLIKHKPSALKFEKCKLAKDSQLRVLTATYLVEGKFATEVEKSLVEHFNMPQLQFICCGWSSGSGNGYGSFVYKNHRVAVRMHSTETLIKTRLDWPKIAKFYVTASLYLDEP